MSAHQAELYSPATGAAGTVVVHGNAAPPARPVLTFRPRAAGRGIQDHGMVAAVAPPIEAGRVRRYCLGSFDAASWADRALPVEERARRHGLCESWILDQVVPFVHGDTGGRLSVPLVCGQGMWEDTTGALESTTRLAGLFAGKGIRHELDLWGHDWPSWPAQIAHHLPRFC